MACYVPFNNKNLDINLYVFRPTVIYVDDLVMALKQFSLHTEVLGCVHSSIFTSIHGNMIVWYGAWMKRSDEDKQLLSTHLLCMLTNVASMAILIDQSFFEPYAGESKDSSPAAKFFTGDIISLSSATLSSNIHRNTNNEKSVSRACSAIFKDRFGKMDGARAGVCFRSRSAPRLVGLFIWKSLQLCYAYILTSDYRTTILPYLDGLANDVKYDVFRVVYVSGDDDVSFQVCTKHRVQETEVDKNEACLER